MTCVAYDVLLQGIKGFNSKNDQEQQKMSCYLFSFLVNQEQNPHLSLPMKLLVQGMVYTTSCFEF